MTVDPTERAVQIRTALDEVRARLAAACTVAQRDPATVALLPVTKYFPAADAMTLIELGCRDLGESREQEASAKVAACRELGGQEAGRVRWHMLGRVQRNKARAISRWASTVHSVDSARLVDALAAASRAALDAGERSTPLRVLLQLSLDGDPARGGVVVDELPALADRVEQAEAVELVGLMAVPPLGTDPDAAFETLAGIRAGFLREHPDSTELSAGMSGDLESAVRHGSTCVRVGTALLGARPIASR
ncbi:YggS family pyridoxal phosphate-dependent enzyme [Speluncibacter jeojiensis]|uniref:Pyridoxal phosphate homeostasis protein n=1 Tax=Speluncibacter jeojiensis TaxID=2710754 RepID=A0A9X4M2Z3_9ACTN|nr:YggS family pyridoxal phosphate-dependent enzyme [Rhodococcus sp. D2-41]MDG3013456.1 YggS family pyridoxal phosphate-dependent enzyme [Corynebacteriales bacterium D3-21]